ncbi:MAG: divalent-cation tolerance protein CutA [Candidatus Eisenbacteria bacterium]
MSKADGGAATDLRVILSTTPDASSAGTLARALVDERLAACVTAVPGARSTYREQDAVKVADEVVLVIKTTAAMAPALAVRLAEMHPYAIPEVIILAPVEGAAPYVTWLLASVGPSAP